MSPARPPLASARDRFVADPALRGALFGAALSAAIDETLTTLLADTDIGSAACVVALGSYARRELCPGSDLDVMLLHDRSLGRQQVADTASALWYPLWDAGFVLGQSARTVKDALAVADDDLDALTALLATRVVAGAGARCADLDTRIGQLAQRRRRRVISALADAAIGRAERPGPVAEMLEPNLKDGAGGLRDIEALAWVGSTLGEPRGIDALVAHGFLHRDDPDRLTSAKATLLDARVALHAVTGGRSDVLALQEQDAVAAQLGVADADGMVRAVAGAARTVTWIASGTWARLRSAERGPSGRVAHRDQPLGAGITLREGLVVVTGDAEVDAELVLRAAAEAAARNTGIDRTTLERFRLGLAAVVWTTAACDAFVALLAAGRSAIPVLEALDQVGVLARLLPEWEDVRSRPQRNAYHRFTVDRHLLEAVAECAALREEPGRDGDVARRAPQALLLLAALLHDLAKGQPGDHSAVGAETAQTVARRIGVGEDQVETLAWLVRHHLLLAETATRRDLSDPATLTRFARTVGTTERLDLLYALTIGDSRATGPAAWTTAKAALMRELFVRVDALLERGVASTADVERARSDLAALIGDVAADTFLDAMPAGYAAAFPSVVQAEHARLLDARELAVGWLEMADGQLEVTVVAPDRTGLLTTVASVLSLEGLDIGGAAGYSHRDEMAVEVFTGTDRFERLTDPGARPRVEAKLAAALRGDLDIAGALRERAARYRPAHVGLPGANAVSVEIDLGASDTATVVEVHAPDRVGLLAQVAGVFASLDLAVTQARVATLADRVVDVFYVRDCDGNKITDRLAVDRLRATLLARLTADVVLPGLAPNRSGAAST